MTGVAHLRAAVAELRGAETSEECGWCRSHIVAVRVLTEDLVRVAEMGEDVGHGEVGEFSRRVGRFAEEIGALGVLGRVIHRVKGLRSTTTDFNRWSLTERVRLREAKAPRGTCGHLLALHSDDGTGPCRMSGCECRGETVEPI